MNVREALKETLSILADEQVSVELQVAAFNKVFDLVAGVPATSLVQTRGAAAQGTQGSDAASDNPGDGVLDRIAKRLNVGLELIEQIYAFEAGELELVVPAGKFPVGKAQATQQIALLIAAGRQAGGIDADGWTSTDVVRKTCENYKRHDSSNFAATIKDMDDIMTMRGVGRDRKMKMTSPAYARATEFVRSLAAGG